MLSFKEDKMLICVKMLSSNYLHSKCLGLIAHIATRSKLSYDLRESCTEVPMGITRGRSKEV